MGDTLYAMQKQHQVQTGATQLHPAAATWQLMAAAIQPKGQAPCPQGSIASDTTALPGSVSQSRWSRVGPIESARYVLAADQV